MAHVGELGASLNRPARQGWQRSTWLALRKVPGSQAPVGAAVGADVVGETVGRTVGESVGAAVFVVGETVGEPVGAATKQKVGLRQLTWASERGTVRVARRGTVWHSLAWHDAAWERSGGGLSFTDR